MKDEKVEESVQPKAHTLTLERDGKATITAVKSVPTFDSSSMDIVLTDENMHIEGEHLEIDSLDLTEGVLTILGRVKSITYAHGEIAKNFFKRLFK